MVEKLDELGFQSGKRLIVMMFTCILGANHMARQCCSDATGGYHGRQSQAARDGSGAGGSKHTSPKSMTIVSSAS